MKLKTLLHKKVYQFRDLKDVLAKANEEKSGDKLAGIAAENAAERIAAKVVLSEVTLGELRENPVVPYEQDEVTRIIQDDLSTPIYNQLRNWTVSELREYLLADSTTNADIVRLRRGLSSEMIAACAKLMSNLDLITCSAKMEVTAHCNTTIGKKGTLSCRLQPNHTTDDPDGVLASLAEGLSFGAGDAVLGLNPVNDSVESVVRILRRFDEMKNRWSIPTQICVLAHVTTQMDAIRQGAPADLIFQSIAAAASAADCKVIGVDVDQSFDSATVITSALKGIGEAASIALKAAETDESWKAFIGDNAGITLGAAENAVGLPVATWSLEGWTVAEYEAMMADIVSGKIVIDNDAPEFPASTAHVTVNPVA